MFLENFLDFPNAGQRELRPDLLAPLRHPPLKPLEAVKSLLFFLRTKNILDLDLLKKPQKIKHISQFRPCRRAKLIKRTLSNTRMKTHIPSTEKNNDTNKLNGGGGGETVPVVSRSGRRLERRQKTMMKNTHLQKNILPYLKLIYSNKHQCEVTLCSTTWICLPETYSINN